MKEHIGKCALCGQTGKLTFEHIPPQSAYNAKPAKPVSGKALLLNKNGLPWELDGLKYENQQSGMGLYSLCEKCNNITGRWYGEAYRSFAEKSAQLFTLDDLSKYHGIEVQRIYPLRIIKQVLSWFCSINPPEVFNLDDLRQFVLNRESTILDGKKYRLHMYFTNSKTMKYAGISTVGNVCTMRVSMLSEITAFPFGFVLYLDPTEDQPFDGFDITAFSEKGYDDICNVKMPIDIKAVNSWLPSDYRSRAEIISTVEESKKWANECKKDMSLE